MLKRDREAWEPAGALGSGGGGSAPPPARPPSSAPVPAGLPRAQSQPVPYSYNRQSPGALRPSLKTSSSWQSLAAAAAAGDDLPSNESSPITRLLAGGGAGAAGSSLDSSAHGSVGGGCEPTHRGGCARMLPESPVPPSLLSQGPPPPPSADVAGGSPPGLPPLGPQSSSRHGPRRNSGGSDEPAAGAEEARPRVGGVRLERKQHGSSQALDKMSAIDVIAEEGGSPHGEREPAAGGGGSGRGGRAASAAVPIRGGTLAEALARLQVAGAAADSSGRAGSSGGSAGSSGGSSGGAPIGGTPPRGGPLRDARFGLAGTPDAGGDSGADTPSRRVVRFTLAQPPGAARPVSRSWACLYAAPELVRGHKLTIKADVYSFAVILFELLSRSLLTAFSDDDDAHDSEVLERYARRAAEGHREAVPAHWPQSVRSIIAACWAAEPHERPNMADVAAQLRAVAGDEAAVRALNRYRPPVSDCTAPPGGCASCAIA